MIRYFLLLISIGIISSCEKPDLTGSDVLPGSDQPGVFTDTIGTKARTVAEDSLVGSVKAYPLFLGSMNDAEIGTSSASLYIQPRLGSSLNDSSFHGITTPDSIVLSLGYRSIYGDSTTLHHISVYEISDSLSADSIYYTTRDFGLKTTGLGYFSFVPNLHDSIMVGSTKQAPQLRLRLNDELGNRFMQELVNNATTFSSNADFFKFFNGIYLKDSVDGNGGVITFDDASSLNAITLYYKKIPTDTINYSYSFVINSNSARNNRFQHQYNMAVFDTVSPTTLYVQSMAGLKTKIEFPNLMNLVDSHAVSINKAELVIKLKSGTSSPLANHSSLLVYAPDSLGRNTLIADVFEPAGFVGGGFSNNEYKLNISRYIQEVINGKFKNYGIYLVAIGSVSNAQRTFLDGTGIKFNLTYTLQNN